MKNSLLFYILCSCLFYLLFSEVLINSPNMISDGERITIREYRTGKMEITVGSGLRMIRYCDKQGDGEWDFVQSYDPTSRTNRYPQRKVTDEDKRKIGNILSRTGLTASSP